MEKEKNDTFYILIFCFLLCFLTYNNIINALKYYLSDYNGHTYVYLPLFSKPTFWVGGKAVLNYHIVIFSGQ